jgi:hypothetical protein
MIVEQILNLIENGEFDNVEPSELLFKKIEQHKRITSQLIKDHGIIATEEQHFRNYASYVLQQGSLSEMDTFIRGLNVPLLVRDRKIHKSSAFIEQRP